MLYFSVVWTSWICKIWSRTRDTSALWLRCRWWLNSPSSLPLWRSLANSTCLLCLDGTRSLDKPKKQPEASDAMFIGAAVQNEHRSALRSPATRSHSLGCQGCCWTVRVCAAAQCSFMRSLRCRFLDWKQPSRFTLILLTFGWVGALLPTV